MREGGFRRGQAGLQATVEESGLCFMMGALRRDLSHEGKGSDYIFMGNHWLHMEMDPGERSWQRGPAGGRGLRVSRPSLTTGVTGRCLNRGIFPLTVSPRASGGAVGLEVGFPQGGW